MQLIINSKISKIFHSYLELSLPVKASIFFTLCSFLQKGISMITVPIFTRLLTTEQYGVFSVYQSWYTILSIVITLSLASGVFNNGMVKYEDKRSQYTSALQGLCTLSTCMFFIIYIVAIDFWNSVFQLSTLYIVVMFTQLLFEPAFAFWSARQRFEFKYRMLVSISLVISLGSPLIGIIAVVSTTYKAEARVMSFALIQVCVGLIFYIYNIYSGKCLFNKEHWKFALLFNIPLIPHYLSMTVLQQADRIMISRMVGSDKAAIYSVAYSISTLMILVSNAINASFVPYTYQALKEKRYSSIEKNANSLVILVGGIALLVMAFGPEVIKVFATSQYYEAKWIIPPVAASVYFMFLYPLFSNIEFYFEENKYVIVASVIGAIANIAFNWIFIPIFGYIVAGYTTLVCYMIFSGAHYLFMNKVIRKHIRGVNIYNMKFIFYFSMIFLIAMEAIFFTYRNNLVRYIVLFLLLCIIIIKRNWIINAIREIKK